MSIQLGRLATVCGIAALVLGATGGASGATISTNPPHHTVTAPTASDRTVHLHIGDKLKVHLGASFRRPASSRPKVLRRLGYAGGYPTNDDASATFKAISTGRADVSSETDYPCLHTTPRCEIAQQIWVVHVVVR